MKKEHHAFENQIFDHFRKQEAEIRKAIKLLKQNKYTVYKRTKK